MKIARQYSGPESIPFWNTVAAIKSKFVMDQVYRLASELQVLESRVLENLEDGLKGTEEDTD